MNPLELLARGFQVIPMFNRKPAVAGYHGLTHQVADEEQVLKWGQSTHQGCHWGIVTGSTYPGGLTVIDIDMKNGNNGIASLDERVPGWRDYTDTFTVRTPSGNGLHLYFTGVCGTIGAGIAPGIDYRSEGGYVVAPGPVKGVGEYTIVKDVPLLPLPDIFRELIESSFTPAPKPAPVAGSVADYASSPEFRAQVERKVQAVAEAMPGEGSRELWRNALHVGQYVGAGQLSENEARAMFRQALTSDNWVFHDSAHEKTTLRTLDNALSRGQADPRAWLSGVTFDEPSPVEPDDRARKVAELAETLIIRQLAQDVAKHELGMHTYEPIAGRLLSYADLAMLPPVKYLLEGYIALDSVVVLHGKTNIGKSFVTLDMALCVAAGIPWCRQKEDASVLPLSVVQGSVLWILGEGASGHKERVQAWMKANGVGPDRIEGFHTYPKAVDFENPRTMAEILNLVQETDYRLVVVDTLSRNTAGLDENAQRDMGLFFDKMDRIREAGNGNTTVMIVHHQGKNTERTDSRGSSVIEASPDTVLRLSKDGDVITMNVTKQRQARYGDDIRFKLTDFGSSAAVIRTFEQTPAGQDSEEARAQKAVATLARIGHATKREWVAALVEEHKRDRTTVTKWITQALASDAVEQEGDQYQARY